jgi:tripartite-type tricarboxylate transporter receptor subunit TctC
LRALAVTSAKHPADLPDIPTMAEAGVKGYDVITWNGLMAPKGTPPEVVAKLNTAINAAALQLTDKFKAIGGYPIAMSPQEFGAMVHGQVAMWAALVKQANVHVD